MHALREVDELEQVRDGGVVGGLPRRVFRGGGRRRRRFGLLPGLLRVNRRRRRTDPGEERLFLEASFLRRGRVRRRDGLRLFPRDSRAFLFLLRGGIGRRSRRRRRRFQRPRLLSLGIAPRARRIPRGVPPRDEVHARGTVRPVETRDVAHLSLPREPFRFRPNVRKVNSRFPRAKRPSRASPHQRLDVRRHLAVHRLAHATPRAERRGHPPGSLATRVSFLRLRRRSLGGDCSHPLALALLRRVFSLQLRSLDLLRASPAPLGILAFPRGAARGGEPALLGGSRRGEAGLRGCLVGGGVSRRSIAFGGGGLAPEPLAQRLDLVVRGSSPRLHLLPRGAGAVQEQRVGRRGRRRPPDVDAFFAFVRDGFSGSREYLPRVYWPHARPEQRGELRGFVRRACVTRGVHVLGALVRIPGRRVDLTFGRVRFRFFPSAHRRGEELLLRQRRRPVGPVVSTHARCLIRLDGVVALPQRLPPALGRLHGGRAAAAPSRGWGSIAQS